MSERDRKQFLWMLFLIGLATLALTALANATTLARMQLDELATKSSAIARVHCLRAESHWKSCEIWTRTDFLVVAANKGSLPRIVEVEMPGGIVGHLHSRERSSILRARRGGLCLSVDFAGRLISNPGLVAGL